MSGCSEGNVRCPQCENDSMNTYVDHKPHPYVEGDCLECGFYFYTADGQHPMEELNELRVQENENCEYEEGDDNYLPPLKSLPNVLGKGKFFF